MSGGNGAVAWSAAALIACLAALSSGCGETSSPPQIAFVTSGGDRAFDRVVACAAKAEARRRGAVLSVHPPTRAGTAAQMAVMRDLSEDSPDAVLIQPEEPTTMTGAVERLAADGTHVVVVGGPPLDHAGEGVSNVGMNYFAAGRRAALAAEPLSGVRNLHRPGPWIGHISTIGGGRDPKTSRLLVFGFEEGHESVPAKHVRNFGPRLVGEDIGQIWSATSHSVQGPPPLTVLVATEIGLAEPAAQRVYEEMAPHQAVTLTYGGGTRAIRALRENRIQALYVEDPRELGAAAVRQALASLDDSAPRRDAIQGTLVTRDALGAGGKLAQLLDPRPC
jgi:ABC-type sugar transport system substrate-binding protein